MSNKEPDTIEGRSLSTFVLLDDCVSIEQARHSRLYTDFVREIVCEQVVDLPKAVAAMQKEINEGFHAVLFCDYEFGAQWVCINPNDRVGSLRILLFRKMDLLASAQVTDWLAEFEMGEGGLFDIRRNMERPQFDEAIRRIKSRIRSGDTYQVNY